MFCFLIYCLFVPLLSDGFFRTVKAVVIIVPLCPPTSIVTCLSKHKIHKFLLSLSKAQNNVYAWTMNLQDIPSHPRRNRSMA